MNTLQLLYFSLTDWDCFYQRPHHFVHWFHKTFHGNVMWVNNYPTRLPSVSDLNRLKSGAKVRHLKNNVPSWLSILQLKTLPVEPVPFVNKINNFLWSESYLRVEKFLKQAPSIVVVSKPSNFAINVVTRLEHSYLIYDVMDDYPAFYSGLSADFMERQDKILADRSDAIWVSCDNLVNRYEKAREKIKVVLNGLPFELIEKYAGTIHKNKKDKCVLGYVGAMGAWFDWEWIYNLAKICPQHEVRLIGPVIVPPKNDLPQNVSLLPACSHEDALKAMMDFDCGLIPFKLNRITDAVDPIKYYEYRLLGLPVISTDFGQMRFRSFDKAVYLCHGFDEIENCLNSALNCTDTTPPCEFLKLNSWDHRFNNSGLALTLKNKRE